MNRVLFKDLLHFVVAADLAFVRRVLQVERFYMLPDLLDNLRPGELKLMSEKEWK